MLKVLHRSDLDSVGRIGRRRIQGARQPNPDLEIIGQRLRRDTLPPVTASHDQEELVPLQDIAAGSILQGIDYKIRFFDRVAHLQIVHIDKLTVCKITGADRCATLDVGETDRGLGWDDIVELLPVVLHSGKAGG